MKKLLLVLVVILLGAGMAMSQGTWSVLNLSNSNLPSDRIISLGIPIDGNVFIGTPGGLVTPSHAYEYNGTDWIEFEWISSFNVAKSSPAGYIVIATGEGVFHYDGTSHSVFNTDNSNLTSNNVSCLGIGTDGFEYVGLTAAGLLFDGGLGIYNESSWLVYNKDNSPLPVKNVLSVLESHTGVLWVGTQDGGLVKKDGDDWTIFDTDNSDIPGNTPTYMAETTDGPLWIAFVNKSIATFDGSNWNIIKEGKVSDFPDAKVVDLLFDTDKNLWIGFENAGLGRFNGTDWIFYTKQTSGLPDDNVTGLELSQDGHIWVSTDGGGIGIYDPEYNSAIESFPANENINLYPNPVNATLNIELQEITGATGLFVYNLMGQLVIQQEMNEACLQIDCSKLNPGLYTLKLKDQKGSHSITRTFIKR